jgi:L-lysine exporter family protein LysE/ArgO
LGFLAGLLLGLALIMPIGVQNLFVLNQGLELGLPRALLAAASAALCDSLLILLGAFGAAAAFSAVPAARDVLIVAGVAFLGILGLRALTTRPHEEAVPRVRRARAIVAQAVGVSLLNPHAILDTVGVVGGAIASRTGDRVEFAAGTVTASWLWFAGLVLAGALLDARIGVRGRLAIQRFSGALMLAFAVVLARELA